MLGFVRSFKSPKQIPQEKDTNYKGHQKRGHKLFYKQVCGKRADTTKSNVCGERGDRTKSKVKYLRDGRKSCKPNEMLKYMDKMTRQSLCGNNQFARE